MIDYVTTSNHTGHFTVNGSRSFDSVEQLFRAGMKATPKAHAILAKWVKEADEKAAACEEAWEELASLYPGGFY